MRCTSTSSTQNTTISYEKHPVPSSSSHLPRAHPTPTFCCCRRTSTGARPNTALRRASQIRSRHCLAVTGCSATPARPPSASSKTSCWRNCLRPGSPRRTGCVRFSAPTASPVRRGPVRCGGSKQARHIAGRIVCWKVVGGGDEHRIVCWKLRSWGRMRLLRGQHRGRGDEHRMGANTEVPEVEDYC